MKTIANDKKLLVLIPYRNRSEHLKKMKPYLSNYLKGQDIPHDIAVIEQSNHLPFNRALLFNVGFDYYAEGYDYVAFHDVDMLPNKVDYSYSSNPTHLVKYRGISCEELTTRGYYGGVAIVPTEVYTKINGFSNDYWGWGAEDDDFYNRCTTKGFTFEKRDGVFKDLERASYQIKKNHENYGNNYNKLISFGKSGDPTSIIEQDGLNTVSKYVDDITKVDGDAHHILVTITNMNP